MAFKPTKAQEQAINSTGNILVSAAAGSGKTAVLVERVIKILTDEKSSVNADELLIVTFTNAAANEMRSRIEKRIEEECLKHPDSVSLLRQKHLLSNAKICTIDSFCIDLVRENFDKLGVQPDFKISDNSTLKQINQAIIYEIINRYITDNNPIFSNLVDLVGGEYDETNLAEFVLKIYEYSRQMPFPQKWFDELLLNYDNGKFTNTNIWYNYAFDKANEIIVSMQNMLLVSLENISNVEEIADYYAPTLNDACEQIKELILTSQKRDWDEFYNKITDFSFVSLPKAKQCTASYREILALKDTFKFFNEKCLPALLKLFYADFTGINAQFKEIYPSVSLLVDILMEFDTRIFEEYNDRNTFTFHNIEHLALKLLCSFNNGEITVNDNARELLDQFAFVMVDEYQDTNDLQDSLFMVLSNFEEKLFVVGDVKQSIYAFRGANPINFLNKKNRYLPINRAAESDAKKIVLGNNFRTKPEVCDFINYFFELFMTNNTGKIVYNVEEKLIPAAVYPQCSGFAVEYDLINTNGSEDKSWVLEARRIAEYIRETMNSGDVIRFDEKTLRKASYGDFTILLRSLSNAGYIINELKEQGIPVDITLDAFAENREISTMLSLLKVIDNPNSDIELLTVLMSPLFAFSADNLAVIRANKMDGTLYSAIVKAAQNGDEMANSFIEKLKIFRVYAVTLSLPDLITKLLIETEFLNIITAFEDGERRKNNLLLLVEYASQFATNYNNNLNDFISYINNLSNSGLKAAGSGSTGNAVKIMTIHSSKGLQFPVCILAGTASRFNDADVKNNTCYNIEYGVGFKYFDEKIKAPLSTISREVIIDNVKSVSLEEELRLLYVALTRTQDKLLILSSFSNLENAIEKYKNRLVSYNCDITKSFFERTSSYADWLIPALLLHPYGNSLREVGDILNVINDNSKLLIKVINAEELSVLDGLKTFKDGVANKILKDKIVENTEFVYPYNDILKLRSKTSVSALSHNAADRNSYVFESKPSFMSDFGMTATARGTAMHRVMQFFDFSKANEIDAELERLYEWQFISENEYNSLDIQALKRFFESDIFKRIQNAQTVKREMRFLTEVSALKIDNNLDERFKDEQIVIQGAVDVCFVENGEVVVLDFKTDRVNDLSVLKDTYSKQLSIYAKACEKIFKLPVKEKIIYSFALSDTVSV